MRIKSELTSENDIYRVVYDILKQSKSFDIFPTPIEQIVRHVELRVDKTGSFHSIPNHYISKKLDAFKSMLSKVFGVLYGSEKTIYVSPELLPVKQNFVQLHEVGHHTMPWQRATLEFIDDERTLSTDVRELFEMEANYFASAALFQLDRFENETYGLPLQIKTARYLSKRFGASIHATLRRYVETSRKRCALLVLQRPVESNGILALRNYFQSPGFTKEFGELPMPALFGIEWPFVMDYISSRVAIDTPEPLEAIPMTENLEYQYFNNRYNVFVLITPIGEKIKSKTKIILPGHNSGV